MAIYGTGADQLVVHGQLGRQAYQDEAIVKSNAHNPTEPGQVLFELEDDETLIVKVMGSDRVIRIATLTLEVPT